jgi:site-specific recombinase XerD
MLQPIFAIDSETKAIRYFHSMPAFAPGFNATDSMSMLGAQNDWEAVLEYLDQYASNANTISSYVKEIERFLLWLIHIANKPISAVNRTDWQQFLKFIESPPADWCGQRAPKFIDDKPNPLWRPFGEWFEKDPLAKTTLSDAGHMRTGLSSSSIRLTQKILESLYNFLVETGHLNANPCMVSRNKRKKQGAQNTPMTRMIEHDLVDEVIDHLYQYQQKLTDKNQIFQAIRARYIIQLFAGTGLRLEELCNHRFENFKISKDEWTLNIIGKGEKPRSIVLFADLKALIAEYRTAIGLQSPTPLYGEQTALAPSMNDLSKPLTPRRVGQIIREAFDSYAKAKYQQAQSTRDPETAGYLLHEVSILEKASAHWLRHLHATYYLKHSGGDLRSTMDRLGHSHVSTTMGYLHTKQQVIDE